MFCPRIWFDAHINLLIFKLLLEAHQVNRLFADHKKVTARQCNLSNIMDVSVEYKQDLLCALTVHF